MRERADFLASKAYLFIRDLDATMTGTDEVGYSLSHVMFVRFRVALVDATYILCPSLLLHLLQMKQQFATGMLFLQYLLGIILEKDFSALRYAQYQDGYIWKIVQSTGSHSHAYLDEQADSFGIKHHRGLDLK